MIVFRGKLQGPVQGNEQAALGAITIELQSNFLPDFDNYFKSLTPAKNTRNPWFTEYWQQVMFDYCFVQFFINKYLFYF